MLPLSFRIQHLDPELSGSRVWNSWLQKTKQQAEAMSRCSNSRNIPPIRNFHLYSLLIVFSLSMFLGFASGSLLPFVQYAEDTTPGPNVTNPHLPPRHPLRLLPLLLSSPLFPFCCTPLQDLQLQRKSITPLDRKTNAQLRFYSISGCPGRGRR